MLWEFDAILLDRKGLCGEKKMPQYSESRRSPKGHDIPAQDGQPATKGCAEASLDWFSSSQHKLRVQIDTCLTSVDL